MTVSFDWNGGIRGNCIFCGAPGFVYHNASVDSNFAMCDGCREDIERRKAAVAFASASTRYPKGQD